MKQKRSVSIVFALVLIIGAVVVMSGCSGVNNKLAGIAYAGTYGGECEDGSVLGSWEFTIDSSGRLNGWVKIAYIENYSGSIKADGSFTGNGQTTILKQPFTITGKIASDNTVTGKIAVQGLNAVSFSGSKK